jgi:hypothetical protein
MPPPDQVKHTRGFGISRIFKTGNVLRAGWRLLIFAILLLGCQTLLDVAILRLAPRLAAQVSAIEKGAFSPLSLLTIEIVYLISVVVALTVMAKIGVRLRPNSRRSFWQTVLGRRLVGSDDGNPLLRAAGC